REPQRRNIGSVEHRTGPRATLQPKLTMGLYANRLQVPIKELSADWFPEEGELFQDSSDNLYMGDNVTASNALTPINGGGGGGGNT
ncbi:hypothetical protein M3M33_15490, partial [Loigolactobacillus coryniformis]|uniref:hypothetical protein n=1 Tax=Loigolactobacillus coryniformis TaxID=1610 RepID=UPI00201ACA62